MIPAQLLRLAVAALILLAPLAPASAAGGQKSKGASLGSPLSVPALGGGTLHPVARIADLTGTPTIAALPGLTAPLAAAPAGLQEARAQAVHAAQAAETFQAPQAQAAVAAIAAASFGTQPQAKAPLVLRAESLGRALLGLGRSEDSAPDESDFVVRPKASPSLGSRLKRSARALAVSAALAVGMMTQAPALPAQQPQAAAQQAHAQAQESRVLRVSSVQEMIQKWDPSVHVVVVGSLAPPAEAAVAQLQSDLRGTHVYVMLVADASDLTFVDDGDNRRRGNDAAEFGFGQGIGSKPAFQALVDGRTGQSDAIKFLVSWGPSRYMAYFPAKTQLDAGLTIELFQQDMLAKMGTVMRDPNQGVRGGVATLRTWVDENVTTSVENRQRSATRAIADAKSELKSLRSEVPDFARRHPRKSISTPDASALAAQIAKAEGLLADKRLAEAAQEAEAAAVSAQTGRKALAAFDAAYASAKDELRSTAAAIDALASASARFRGAHEKADGDLSRPKLGEMRGSLSAAAEVLETNPAGASARATAVRRSAQSGLDALAVYENDAQEIKRVRGLIEANAKTQRASAGAVERQKAKTALDEAAARYERGESSYKQSLNSAREHAKGADARVAEADANAARNRLIAWLLSLLALSGIVAFLTRLAYAARPAAREARKQYAEKKALVDGKLEAVFGATPEAELGNFDTKVETLVGPAEGPDKKDLTGRTAEIAAQVREDAAAMSIIWPAMNRVLELAAALIFPKGVMKLVYFFRRKPFEKGLKMLKDEPVTFAPEDGIPQLFGKTRNWRDDLYGSVSSQAGFTKSFEELVAEYNMRAKRAAEAVTLIEKKIFALEPTVQEIERAASEAAALEAVLAGAGGTDGLFLLTPLFATLLPASAEALKKLQSDHRRDPIGAIDGSGTDSARMAADAKLLAQWANAARATEIAAAYAAKKALSEADFETAWIDKAFFDLSQRADAAAEKAVERSIVSELKSLDERAKAIAAQAASAVALAKRLAELGASIAAMESDVAAARDEIAAATGAPADKTLREKGLDPTKTLAGAGRSAEAAQEAISKGKIADAEQALAEGEKQVGFAKQTVADGRAAIAAQADGVAHRVSESARIKALQPARELILKDIKKRFAASVLSQRSGDPAHPSADGTIDNNIEETVEHLEQADAKRAKAEKSFSEGSVLDAADLLRQSAGHLVIAQHRLDEISEKLARLEATVASNAAFLARMQKEIDARKAGIADDMHSQEPTREALRVLRGMLKTAKDAVEEAKGNPFDAETELNKVEAELKQVDVRFKNDVDQYNEAARSLQAAASQIQSAANEASTAKNDGHGDSPAIVSAYNALEALRRAHAAAKTDLGQPHGSWSKIDIEADRITSEAAKVAATLRQETQAAEEASAAISNAASKVREATNWTGRYGVSIPGSPGSDELSNARSALSGGRYADAESYASRARSEAANAISRAEAEVDRLYREEQRRLEEERRERQRQEDERQAAARRAEESRNSGGGGGGFGGSSSGGGGGSW